MKKALVTGATGFVGWPLCSSLHQAGYALRAALRTDRSMPDWMDKAVVGDIGSTTDWKDALEGIDVVFHLAAKVHVFDRSNSDVESYMEVNGRGTQKLVLASAEAGVRRFIYLSSIKVNGEETRHAPFGPSDLPRPCDAYAKSKWRGEQSAMTVSEHSALDVVIVRSPLVYGSGVRANFARLMKWVDKGWPLPLGAVRNVRSLVNIWNLVDMLTHVARHPVAVGRTWMVSDDEDLSTPELVRRIAAAMSRQVTLVPVPVRLLRIVGQLVGRAGEVSRLCNSLTVDISSTRQDLDWSPPVSVQEALSRTADWYLEG